MTLLFNVVHHIFLHADVVQVCNSDYTHFHGVCNIIATTEELADHLLDRMMVGYEGSE